MIFFGRENEELLFKLERDSLHFTNGETKSREEEGLPGGFNK